MSFDFGSQEPKGKSVKKPLKALLGVGVLAGAIALGSTFAANINLNAGAPVEFGQGVTQTTACDSEIVMTPLSNFVNGVPGAFMFSGLKLDHVDTTTGSGNDEGCAGKTFTIKLFKENGDLIGTAFTIAVSDSGVFSTTIGDSIITSDADTNQSIGVLTLANPTIFANNVYSITIESAMTVQVEESYYPDGPQEDVLKSRITRAGWTLCWSSSYASEIGSSVGLRETRANCSKDKIMFTGWANSAPENLIVLAAAPRIDVFADTLLNEPILSNGTYWYNTADKSIGFSEIANIIQNPCPVARAKSICWPAYSFVKDHNDLLYPGLSLGSTDLLLPGQGGENYTRAIYQHD